MNPSEEIKAKLDIVDVLRDYIQVRPAGVNFRALCPFHKEKTPSFLISPDKQIWHCFGCGKGGDIFTFVMEMEGLSFVEALRLLAPKAGVVLSSANFKNDSARNRLLDIMSFAVQVYHHLLFNDPSAAPARAYLQERGLTEETIDNWQIGFSLDSWEAMTSRLKQKGFREQEIFLAGLAIKREERSSYYDRFRGRLMFPIRDLNGNPVAFSARVLPAKEKTEKLGKYINSPQTPIYDKSRIVFGLDAAKRAIKEQDLAVIVEGQMDAITAHQHGFQNVVAVSGAALTAEQIALIKRFTNNLALSFDMDAAGLEALRRGAKEAWRAEMNINVIAHAAKDPDELIRKNPAYWSKAVSQARPAMEYLMDKYERENDMEKIAHRKVLAKEGLSFIAAMKNKIDQDFWLKKLGRKIDVSEAILKEALAAAAGREIAFKPETAVPAQPATKREEKASDTLLALMLKLPVLAEYVFQRLEPGQIIGEANRRIYKYLQIFYNNFSRPDNDSDRRPDTFVLSYEDFRAWLESSGQSAENTQILNDLNKIVLLGERDFFDFSLDQARQEMISLCLFLKKNYLSARSRELEKMLAAAEQKDDREKIDLFSKQFKELQSEIRSLERSSR
ncbi:DNA primase [Candidatus Falkowbacteria bacterium CG_4_10_14_0_2_um_filter_48_10]|nr:MAG: DNA primase [Candidatus Falkowbacteria bacterium CG_4_10_14_0_2_um_filter_48_10]